MTRYSYGTGTETASIILNDFSGGMVNTPQVMDYAQLSKTQSPYCYNVDTSGKSIRKIKGFSKVTTGAITGDISTIWYDTLTSTTYVGYGTQLGTITGTSITQITGGSGFTSNKTWAFCRVGSYILCINGTDQPKLWNGTALSNITTPPATWAANNYPLYATNWMGRAFAFITNSDTLFYSKLRDLTDWSPGTAATSGGAFVVGSDGAPIRATVPLANGLLVIKDAGLYYFSGTGDTSGNFDQTTFDYRMLSTEVDCLSPRAVVEVGDALIVWGRNDVFWLEGTQDQQRVSVTRIGAAISYDINNVTALQAQVTAAHYPQRNQVWFAVAKDNGSTTIDTVYCYDYVHKQWFKRNGYAHKCMANVKDPNGVTQIYSGGYSPNGYIYQQNSTYDFDGAAILWQYYTSWIPLVGIAKGRSPLAIISLGPDTTQPISYTYAYDYNNSDYTSTTLSPNTSSSTWHTSGGTGTSTWGTGGGTTGTYSTGSATVTQTKLYGRGRTIQHRFSGNVVGSNFAILEIMHPVTNQGYR